MGIYLLFNNNSFKTRSKIGSHENLHSLGIYRVVKPYEENKEISKQYAEEDISSVRNSDVFILLSNQEGSTGAHVEFGAALALAKEKGKPKIYVVGDHTSRSLFYYHHLVNIRK